MIRHSVVREISIRSLNSSAETQSDWNTMKHRRTIHSLAGDNRGNQISAMATLLGHSPYSFSNLLASSLLGQEHKAKYERGLSLKTAELLGHGPVPNGGILVPPSAMLRDLFTGASSSGGNLVESSVARVAEAVRPQLVLERAGANRIETAGSGISLPRWDDAVAGWIAEGSAATSLSTTIATVDATPHGASARLAFSRKLKLLGQDVEGQMLAEIGRAVGALIESGCLTGTGTKSQPLGLLNLTGKLTTTFTSTTPTYAELAVMVGSLAAENVDVARLAFVIHPQMLSALMLQPVAAGSSVFCVQWMEGQWRCLGVPVFVTSNIPAGKVLLADFSAVNIVYFGAAQIIFDSYTNGRSINGATEITVLNYADVVVTNETSIAVGSN